MNRWRRWRSREPAGRASPRRAGLAALALFAVTAGLALLLAAVSGQAWPPVLISILLGVPALYLAWLAVAGGKGQFVAAWPDGGIRWTWACTR